MPAKQKTYKQKLLALAAKNKIKGRSKMNVKQLEAALNWKRIPLPAKPARKKRKAKARTKAKSPVGAFPTNQWGAKKISFKVKNWPIICKMVMSKTLLKRLADFTKRHQKCKLIQDQNKQLNEEDRLYKYYKTHFEPWLDDLAKMIKTQDQKELFSKYIQWMFSEELMMIHLDEDPTDNIHKAFPRAPISFSSDLPPKIPDAPTAVYRKYSEYPDDWY